MKRTLILSITLILLAACACAVVENNEEATKVICNVLEGVRSILFTITLAIGVFIYIPLLLAGAVVYILLKEDKKSFRLIRKAVLILLAGVPFLVLLAIIVIYLAMEVFSGPC